MWEGSAFLRIIAALKVLCITGHTFFNQGNELRYQTKYKTLNTRTECGINFVQVLMSPINYMLCIVKKFQL
jgi:hypothetical protein